MDAERATNWVQAERGRAAVIALAEDLAAVDVTLLVFKGLHLSFCVAPSPDYRFSKDADALVLSGSFERAAARVRALSRWRLDDANVSAHWLTDLETGAHVDLHRRVLPPRFGRMRRGALRAHARLAPQAFGPRVFVPDTLDAAVFAVANYAKDCLGSFGSSNVRSDLALMQHYGGLEPAGLAARLTTYELRRVGLLTFSHLAADDPAWESYRDACAASGAEKVLAGALSRAVANFAGRSERLAFLAVRLVGDSPSNVLSSGSLALARFGRDFMRLRGLA